MADTSGDEHVPLLEENTPTPEGRTPLPTFQLFVISLIQFAEPVTAMVIYPFIVQLVSGTGVPGGDETKVGYFAGIIESIFFLAEALTVHPWSLLSNVYGRRPVLLIGPLGLVFATLGFGLTSNFYALVIFRAIQGVCNGNIGLSRTVIAEITDSTNMSQAYSLSGLMWSSGSTVGPLLGGFLANPADRWSLFTRWVFFKEHPFFLACATVAVIPLVSFLFGLLGLQESSKIITTQRKKASTVFPEEETCGLLEAGTASYGTTTRPQGPMEHTEDVGPPEEVYTFRQLIAVPRFFLLLQCRALLNFISMGYTCLLPLVYSASIENGGLGLEPRYIGTVIASVGFAGALLAVWVTQPLIQRVGPKTVLVYSMTSIGLACIVFSLISISAHRAGRVDGLTIFLVVIQQILNMTSCVAFPAMQMLIVDASPNPASLASVNSLGQMVSCLSLVVAPTVVSSLYSVSVSNDLLGGYLVHVILLVVACGASCNAARLDESMRTLK